MKLFYGYYVFILVVVHVLFLLREQALDLYIDGHTDKQGDTQVLVPTISESQNWPQVIRLQAALTQMIG